MKTAEQTTATTSAAAAAQAPAAHTAFETLVSLETARLAHERALSQQGVDLLTRILETGAEVAREAIQLQRDDLEFRRERALMESRRPRG